MSVSLRYMLLGAALLLFSLACAPMVDALLRWLLTFSMARHALMNSGVFGMQMIWVLPQTIFAVAGLVFAVIGFFKREV